MALHNGATESQFELVSAGGCCVRAIGASLMKRLARSCDKGEKKGDGCGARCTQRAAFSTFMPERVGSEGKFFWPRTEMTALLPCAHLLLSPRLPSAWCVTKLHASSEEQWRRVVVHLALWQPKRERTSEESLICLKRLPKALTIV